MGCDGGTIPKRDELVRKKKKPEQKDKNSELSFRWQHCTITQQPLQKPIVACGLGRLYNKDAVIEAILSENKMPETAQHIKSLKDIKDLQLTNNSAFKPSAEKGDGYVDWQTAPYICPVIGLEMNGKFRFVFLWGCGCVMSERALKEVKTKVCHKCQQPFTDHDVVILNGNEDDVELMKTRMEARQAQMRAAKKLKAELKCKNKIHEAVESLSVKASTSSQNDMATSNVDIKTQPGKDNISCKKAGKLIGMRGLDDCTSMKRSSNGEISDPQFKKTKGSYSVAKDPRATEVFKSLFTSHRTAREQTKAHWITYNPFYN